MSRWKRNGNASRIVYSLCWVNTQLAMNINKTLTCSALFSLLSDELKLLLLPDNKLFLDLKTTFNLWTQLRAEWLYMLSRRELKSMLVEPNSVRWVLKSWLDGETVAPPWHCSPFFFCIVFLYWTDKVESESTFGYTLFRWPTLGILLTRSNFATTCQLTLEF